MVYRCGSVTITLVDSQHDCTQATSRRAGGSAGGPAWSRLAFGRGSADQRCAGCGGEVSRERVERRCRRDRQTLAQADVGGDDVCDGPERAVAVRALLHVAVADDLGLLALLGVGLLQRLGALAEGEHPMPSSGVVVRVHGEVELGAPHPAWRGGVADARTHAPCEGDPLLLDLAQAVRFRVRHGGNRWRWLLRYDGGCGRRRAGFDQWGVYCCRDRVRRRVLGVGRGGLSESRKEAAIRVIGGQAGELIRDEAFEFGGHRLLCIIRNESIVIKLIFQGYVAANQRWRGPRLPVDRRLHLLARHQQPLAVVLAELLDAV